MLCIKHATVYTPAYELADATVLIADGRIAAIGPADQISLPPGTDTLEADGMLLLPGFIDLQINGAFGDDFTLEPETIWRVASGLPRYGVTAFLPTIITSPPAQVSPGPGSACLWTAGRVAGQFAPWLALRRPISEPGKKGRTQSGLSAVYQPWIWCGSGRRRHKFGWLRSHQNCQAPWMLSASWWPKG